MELNEFSEIKKLSECAEIKTGLVLSRKKSDKIKKYRYDSLNLKSINSHGYIEKENLDPFYSKEILNEEYLTKPGDIIIRLTAPYTAVLIDEDSKGIVFSSNFIKIETDSKKLVPEYLEWYLNSSKVKKHIDRQVSGTVIRAVNPGYYKNLNVKLITLEKQNKLAEISKMMKNEELLLRTLLNKKEILNKALINEILKK